jgi:hypothetical protein
MRCRQSVCFHIIATNNSVGRVASECEVSTVRLLVYHYYNSIGQVASDREVPIACLFASYDQIS